MLTVSVLRSMELADSILNNRLIDR